MNEGNGSVCTGVVIAVPTLQRAVSVEFVMALTQTLHQLARAGIPAVVRMIGGDPFVAKVRNRLASDFLRMPAELSDLFFIDDDIGWPPEKVIEFLRCPYPVLAGVYPEKSDQPGFPCELVSIDGEFVQHDGYYQAGLVPTGFLKIKRHVLQSLAEESGVFADKSAESGDVPCWNIFEAGYIADPANPKVGRFFGEDYMFSTRWRALGGEIWVDPDIVFTHRGQKVWSAALAPSLELTQARMRHERSQIAAEAVTIAASPDELSRGAAE